MLFGVGQDRVTAHLHFLNDASRKGRERFLVEAQPLDPAVITTRPTTEVMLLDDETPGTFSPVSFPWNRSFPSALAVQGDGRILTAIGSGIIRLHPDGTVDESFVSNGIPVQGGITEIRQIKPQANGQIYVAGKFHTTLTANPDINHVARLNSDGTLDRTFNPRLRPGSTFSNRDMAAVDVLADGKVVIWTSGQVRPDFGLGGMFLYSETGSLIRQYSSITPWQDSALMEHLPTGEVFAYGHVSSYSQLPKYKTNGVMDTNFVARITGQIHTMKSADGSLYLAGNLRSLNGTPVSYIAKVNAITGELDPAFKPQLDGRVTAFHLTPTHIYISGQFTTVNGIPRFRLARLTLDGTLDESFDPGVGPVESLGFLHEENDEESIVVYGGEMFDRVKSSQIFRLESGVGSSTPEPGTLEITSDESGVIVNFSGGRLEQSDDLQSWHEVDTVGGSYRPGVVEAMRFFRVVTP